MGEFAASVDNYIGGNHSVNRSSGNSSSTFEKMIYDRLTNPNAKYPHNRDNTIFQVQIDSPMGNNILKFLGSCNFENLKYIGQISVFFENNIIKIHLKKSGGKKS